MSKIKPITRYRVSYRVIYGDTDQMGVAYYANYLKWFEMGRNEFMRKTGTPYTSIEKEGLVFPVIEVSCRYHSPARYDEVIVVETSLTSLGPVTLVFSYEVLKQKDNQVLATGWSKHACLNRQGQITKIPSHFQETMKPALSDIPSGPRRPRKRVSRKPA
ncbi:MAG TPA: thioesterase family protein [Candidatus Binatia bacterium]